MVEKETSESFFVGKSPKREGSVYNGKMEERAKGAEGALGTSLTRQCSPNWCRMVKSVHQGDGTLV